MIKAHFLSPTVIEADGLTAKDVCTLSRLLVERGHENQPMEVYRGSMKCLEIKNISVMAKRSLVEDPSLRYVKYREFVPFEDVTESEGANP